MNGVGSVGHEESLCVDGQREVEKVHDEDAEQLLEMKEEDEDELWSPCLEQLHTKLRDMKEEEDDGLWIASEAVEEIHRLPLIVRTVKSEEEEHLPQPSTVQSQDREEEEEEDLYPSRTHSAMNPAGEDPLRDSMADACVDDRREPGGSFLPPAEGRTAEVWKVCVKKEDDDLWAGRGVEELCGLKEEETERLQLTVVTVKTEDEEKHLHETPNFPIQDGEHGSDLSGSRTANAAHSDISNAHISISIGDDGSNQWVGTTKRAEVKARVGSNGVGKPFSCSNCGKHFNHRQSLQRHLRRNSDSGSSKGFILLKCVRLKLKADSHGEKLFSCDVCGKRLKYRHNLKTHMRVHTGEKSFGCDVCGQRFAHQQNLKSHRRTHTGEKPFVCQVCGKNVCNLKIHLQVHTGEKPFSCSDCGKSFKRKAHLTTHMTVHNGERPFGCELCTKRFNRKCHLRTHMIVHSGDKPFSCELCGKKFNRKTHLDTHFAIHTGERPFCCAICGQEFTQLGSLNRHMRFHLG